MDFAMCQSSGGKVMKTTADTAAAKPRLVTTAGTAVVPTAKDLARNTVTAAEAVAGAEAAGQPVRPPPRVEPRVEPVNGIVQPPVVPPPDRRGRNTNVLNEIKSILNQMWRCRWASYFKYPVDSIAFNIPDYHKVVQRSMDLNTIRRRLGNCYYWEADEALEDFDLVFNNCMFFNPPNSPVYEAGRELKDFFYKKLAAIDRTNEYEMKAKQHKKKRKMAGFSSSTQPKPAKVKDAVPADSVAKPMTVDISYAYLDRMIEKSHCEHLIKTMLKRKNAHYGWPFKCADHWERYSSNPNYDHEKEEKLDWQILQQRLADDLFDDFDGFINTVRQMMYNAMRCFPDQWLLKSSVKKTSEIFEGYVPKYACLVADAKLRARALVTSKCMEDKNTVSVQHSSRFITNSIDNMALSSEEQELCRADATGAGTGKQCVSLEDANRQHCSRGKKQHKMHKVSKIK